MGIIEVTALLISLHVWFVQSRYSKNCIHPVMKSIPPTALSTPLFLIHRNMEIRETDTKVPKYTSAL